MRKGKIMKKAVSVLGFAGYSGSGKTTLIEKLIPLLEQKGIRTAALTRRGRIPGVLRRRVRSVLS